MSRSHYYAFSFLAPVANDGTMYASVYIGYPQRDQITKPRIQEAKEKAGVPSTATLIAVSYLGRMTREQMLGADDNPEG